MRKILALIVLVIGLVTIAPAPDAGAHYLPPQQWHRDYANCTHDAAYSTFGNGFAQMELVGSNCSFYSQVGVVTAHDGHTHVAWCNVYTALFAPTSSCFRQDHDGHTGIMVVVHGTAISMAVISCYDSNGNPICTRLDNGAFMSNNGLHTPPQF